MIESSSKKVKLHGRWTSSYSLRVEIAFKLKDVEFERVEEDTVNKSAELLRLNPVHKKIPVLVHGDHIVIPESRVILEYVDETWDSGARLLPKDPYQRALARFWAAFVDEKVKYLLLFLNKEDKQQTLEYMKLLDKELEGKRFFGGETIGFVDIVSYFLGCGLDVLEEASGRVMVTSEEAYPNFCKWRREFVSCDVIQKTMPPKDRLLDYYRGRITLPKPIPAAPCCDDQPSSTPIDIKVTN
ncbi:hypothetical protein V2J09_015777 [Rumex salicifolius]